MSSAAAPPALVDRRELLGRLNEALAIDPLRTAVVAIDCHPGHLDPACVQCAAFEVLDRDLRCVVVSDCVASMHGDDLRVFGLHNIARRLGWVLTLDELRAKIGENAVEGA